MKIKLGKSYYVFNQQELMEHTVVMTIRPDEIVFNSLERDHVFTIQKCDIDGLIEGEYIKEAVPEKSEKLLDEMDRAGDFDDIKFMKYE